MKTKPRTFYSLKDLEQIISEMAGVNEFTSNASGKEEVDSLFEKYQKAQAEYDAIQKIIDDAKLKIEKLNDEIIIYNLATNTKSPNAQVKALEESVAKTTKRKDELNRLIDETNSQITYAKSNFDTFDRYTTDCKKELHGLTPGYTCKDNHKVTIATHDAEVKQRSEWYERLNQLTAYKIDLTNELNRIDKDLPILQEQLAKAREYNQRKTEQAKLERIISVNQRKLNKLKADIAVIKQQYNNLKKIYDAQVSEEQRIQAEAFKVEQELKAAENARIYGEQMQKKLQEEEAAAKKKLQEEEAAAKQKEKTKKLIIGGIAALLLIGGIVIGVKKGWFKKK